jgi:predicted phosphodiesterase
MEVAVISDLHGNLVALEAALADLDAQSIEHIACLGDVAVLGPQPREVIARLKALDCSLVMGNTDAWLLDPQPYEMRDEDSHRVLDVELWSARQLASADLDFVRTFQPTVKVPLGDGADLLCFHGSPRSNADVIRSTTPDDDLAPMLSGFQATVMAGGHTHTQMLRRFRDVTLINPGSVGLPFDHDSVTGAVRNPAWAEYAVVRWQDGHLGVELRRVPFDLKALTRAVFDSGMPHAEWWIKDWCRG